MARICVSNVEMFFRIIVLFALLAQSSFAYDYGRLLDAETYKNVDTTYYSPWNAKAVARIVFDSMSFENRGGTTFGLNIPQTLVIKNLKLTVFPRNIANEELDNLKMRPPFGIAADKISIRIMGKNSVLVLSADSAKLNPDMSITRSGNVSASLDGKRADYPQGAELSITGRTLYIRGSGKSFGVKF